MAANRPSWLADLSRSFKRHRASRPGWFIELARDRLRVVSAEFPPRPDEPRGEAPTRRSLTLHTPPGPTHIRAALEEACVVFDDVMAGTWRWPSSEDLPADDSPERLTPTTIRRLSQRLQEQLLGERMGTSTWERTWLPYLERLVAIAGEHRWAEDADLLTAYLRHWEANSRSRQMAYDRARRLWKEARWSWPEELQAMRGNGKAAADPRGVRAFSDEEVADLRQRLQASIRLTPSDLVAWDCLICFGLRPAELQGLELVAGDHALPVAVVSHEKRNSKGSTGARQVPAVAPAGWPADCYGLMARWHAHGLPEGLLKARSPGQLMTQQLRRLHLPDELTAYGCRHAFALRLGLELQLSVREAAELMGHSPAVHLSTYGRRLDQPKLQSKVAALALQRGAC